MQLTPRQEQVVRRARTTRCVALFWPVGTGKSIAALAICHQAWHAHSILIVARANNLLTWQTEAVKYGGDLQIVIHSHDMMRNKGLFKQLQACKFDAVIVDESYQIKNYRSRRSHALYHITRRIPRRVILNALPFSDQGYLDVFGQFKILDGGVTYGTSTTRFRELYQYPHPAGYGYTDNPDMLKYLTRKAAASSDFMDRNECDLPEQFSKTFHVEWNPKQKEIYETLRDKWGAIWKDTELEVNHTVSKLCKLHQISGGIFRTHHRTIDIPTNKLQVLTETVLPQIKGRSVVWCAYNPELELVARHLRNAGYVCSVYNGASDPSVLQEKWQVLVAQVRCGVGLNDLTQVQYAIYYSKYWNYFYDYQSRGRTARMGSNHKRAFYFSLVIPGSVDDLVEKILEKKETNAKEFAALGRQLTKEII